MPLDKHAIIKAVRDMDRGDEVERILIIKIEPNEVIVSGFNTNQDQVVKNAAIPAPNGVSSEITEGMPITL